MVSIVNPESIVVTIAQAGTDPFDTSSTGYAEMLGIEGFSISGGEKDYEAIVTFASSASDRYHGIDKPASMVELSLESGILNFDDWKTYFYNTTGGLADRTTNTLAIGIKLTEQGGNVEKWKFDNARITSVEVEGSTDEQVKGSITVKCLPTDVTFTTS